MEWFYARNDIQRGPVSEKELQDLISDGIIKPATRVWRDGMSDWLPLSEIGELIPPGESSNKASPSPVQNLADDETPKQTFQSSFHSESYSYNGKDYNSLNEMPEEVRAFFEKVDFGNCLPEFADTGNTTYEYNGKKYSSFEEMPPEAQEMFRDNNQNGIPDIFEN